MGFRIHKRSRMNYWSTSALVYKLQGKSKEDRKILYSVDEMMAELDKPLPFIERAVDFIQNTVMFPGDLIYSIKCYYSNVINQSHVLSGTLEKGQWCDLDYRISHCLFSELEKFILKEKGLETHEWEKTLTLNEDWGVEKDDPRYGQPTNQALAAVEQEEIYSWWKANKNKDEEFVSLDDDQNYREKETEMLIRLIKIRGSLWT